MGLSGTSEKELIKSFINGNHSSLQTLIERHQSRLYSYIFLLVKDKQLADDVFQDTYVKVINTLKRGVIMMKVNSSSGLCELHIIW